MQVKVLQNALVKRSVVLLTCIKVPHGFKTFGLRPLLKTGFHVTFKLKIWKSKITRARVSFLKASFWLKTE